QLITFEHFMKFGSARDSDARVQIGAQGFLEATNFAAIVVTYGSRSMKAHSIEYEHGYSSEVHDYIRKAFVLEDPFYDEIRTSGKAKTWDGSDFSESYAAERWLKPMGFQNGVSNA